MDLDQELHQKLEALRGELGSLDSLLVAYSGGTDSAFLAYVAHLVLGERMIAVIADSPSLPRRELAAALDFASQHGIPTHILQTRELDDPNYARNDQNRCFHCKDELFTQMEAARVELGFARLAYGMNLDDRNDIRPGQKAAALHNALAPLAAANLTKQEIRSLARLMSASATTASSPASRSPARTFPAPSNSPCSIASRRSCVRSASPTSRSTPRATAPAP